MHRGVITALWIVLLALMAAAACLLVTCGRVPDPGSHLEDGAPAVWEYPIHLGDPRSKVHELLGGPEDPTLNYKEVYPASGVEVWFGREDRVTKFSFIGNAAALYQASAIQIPSARTLMLGLTARSMEADFRRALGPPTQEDLAGQSDARERHCVWKTRGLLIDAQFLAADRTGNGKTFREGALLWFYVSPAL